MCYQVTLERNRSVLVTGRSGEISPRHDITSELNFILLKFFISFIEFKKKIKHDHKRSQLLNENGWEKREILCYLPLYPEKCIYNASANLLHIIVKVRGQTLQHVFAAETFQSWVVWQNCTQQSVVAVAATFHILYSFHPGGDGLKLFFLRLIYFKP